VGIALSIGGGVYYFLDGTKKYNEKFATVEKYDTARTEVAKKYSDVNEREAALAAFEKERYIKAVGILTILGQIFCLIGVIKMRNLNKEGFALYTVGELGVPIATSVLVGLMSAKGLTVGPPIITLIVGIIMVVLYGTRLEEMSLSKRQLA